MKKLYSTIMMFAMMVAALSLSACGGDDDDNDVSSNGIVGVWEVVSFDFEGGDNVKSDLKVGDKLYLFENGTYRDDTSKGKWKLNGNTLTIIDDGEYSIPAVMKIEKLTLSEMVLSIDYGIFSSTIKYKRVS